jgi:DNA-binding response OmpR family regulator
MIVDRRELTERVYDGDAEVDSNSIEVIIARLRKKLGADRIETVRGRGYMLTAAVAP